MKYAIFGSRVAVIATLQPIGQFREGFCDGHHKIVGSGNCNDPTIVDCIEQTPNANLDPSDVVDDDVSNRSAAINSARLRKTLV